MQVAARTERFGIAGGFLVEDLVSSVIQKSRDVLLVSLFSESLDAKIVDGRLLSKPEFSAVRPTYEYWEVGKIESLRKDLPSSPSLSADADESGDLRVSAWSREWRVPKICVHINNIHKYFDRGYRQERTCNSTWDIGLVDKLYRDMTPEERKSYHYESPLFFLPNRVYLEPEKLT